MTNTNTHKHLLSDTLVLADEGGAETGIPGETPGDELQNAAYYFILKPEDSSPKRDLNPHNSIYGRLEKQTC